MRGPSARVSPTCSSCLIGAVVSVVSATPSLSVEDGPPVSPPTDSALVRASGISLLPAVIFGGSSLFFLTVVLAAAAFIDVNHSAMTLFFFGGSVIAIAVSLGSLVESVQCDSCRPLGAAVR